MKKSLLKRAIASAVAVPLALTQCLAPVFAADDLTTLSAADSQTKAITLSSITNVAVDAPIEADGYQHSSWNKTVAAALLSLDDVQYTPDTTALFESITNASGKYKEQVAAVLANVRDTKVTYDSLGTTVTVSGTLDDISSVVVDQIKNNINNTLEGLSGKYGEDVLANFKDISIDCPEISGTVKIVADLSTIGATRSGSVDGVFIAEDGTEYKLGGENSIFDYADEKLPAIKESLLKAVIKAENAANAVSGDNSGSEVADTISKTIKKWTGRVNTAKLKLEAGKTTSKSVSGENLADVLAQVKAKYPKYSKRLPSSAADAASKPRVQKAFNGAINQLNKLISSKGYSVDISLEEAALAADSLYDINAALNNGVVTFSAKMAEDQMAELESYYAGLNKEVVSSYKVVNITADYAALYSGAGNFSLDIYRVIETKDKEPIVTTTTPQGSVTTTATATTPQGGSTTTTTGPVSPGTGTATSMIGFFAIDSEIETTYGFYFSHDTNEFNKGQIIKVIAHCTFQKEDGTIEESDVDLTADIGFNGQTPYSMFKKSLGNVYEVPLYYGDEPLTYEDGSPVTVLALIGVKGDADLNNTVDAIDASNVLTYYAQKQTGVESPVLYQGPTDVLKGVNEKFGNVIKGLDQLDVLDELACFLADVDVDEYSADNWKTHKGNRAIDAIDASNILSFYAKVQTGSPADSATWDEVLGR